MASQPPVERPIDRALSLAAAGDATSALRYAVVTLENAPESALALFVVGYALAAAGQREPAARAFTIAAGAAVDASNLPLAVAAGAELGKVGEDPSPIYDAIASAF